MKGLQYVRRIFSIGCALLATIALSVGCTKTEEASVADSGTPPVVIAIENVTLGAEYPDTAKVEEAINKITLPALNCKVKIINYHIADHAAKVTLAVNGGEQLDIINTGLTTSLSSFVSDGTVIPLDALLQSYGKDLYDKEGALLKATTVNGKVYALPANLYPSKANGIGYNKSTVDKYQLDFPEEITLASLTKLGQELKSKAPQLYLATNGDGALTMFDIFYFLEAFGGDLNYGVVFDPLHQTKIVNVYASEAYRTYCQTLKQWRELGYIPEDSMTNGQNGQSAFNSGLTLLQQMNISPHGEQIAIKKGLPFQEVLVASTPNVLSTSSVQEYAWGITSSCEHPEVAMAFLTLLYTNEALANLLANGLPDLHYEKVSEHIIKYPEGVTGDTVGYGRIFSMYGDSTQLLQFEPATESFYEDLITFSKTAQPILTLGYTFNAEVVASEIAAVTSVASEYRPILECGVSKDVDETLEAFNKALKEAGIERIIDENQRQLNAWLEHNKEINRSAQ